MSARGAEPAGPIGVTAPSGAALGRGHPRTLQPQRHFLVLLSTADGRAIAARGAFGASGAWAGWWKERIDRGFVAGFRP